MASKTDDDFDSSLPSSLDDTWLERTRFGKFLGRPCVGSSFAFGTGAYFAAFLSTFGWTSNWRKSNMFASIAFGLVTVGSSTYCTLRNAAIELRNREMTDKEKEEKQRKQEALQKKIEERKRKHEERKNLKAAKEEKDNSSN